jgi:hypothetical protein
LNEGARERPADAADRSGRRLDRLEVIGQCDKARGFERPAVDPEQAHDLIEIFRRPQREDGVVGEEADRLRRRGQQLADDAGIRVRGQIPEALRARRREREAPQGSDNPIEFKGPEAACVHAGRRLGEGVARLSRPG